MNTSNSEISDKSFSWGAYIGKICGSEIHNFATGGLTTRSWISNWGNSSDFINNPCMAYIIGLGVNDKYRLSVGDGSGGVIVGTESDIDINNKDNCADTYYGNYAKIIMRIKEIQPRARIFCITRPAETSEIDEPSYNDAVRYMSTIFNNVYILDFYKHGIDIYQNELITNNNAYWNNAHGTAIGYLLFAKHIISYINYIIENNMNQFKDAAFIGTEYTL